ncbi:uncharacterized protein LOC113330708 [Papaver somniferum]|uniref:uncharacterized protein LOC113330708 n=1 Tax=Papaver somniferum TaxID=3469 RepID=UPI000E706037|nr:uncharacterized protein LOC113330708 [Papaver somniferum]
MEKIKCFVGGTTDGRKLQIANNCGMSLSKFPDKYLGVNLIPGRIISSHVWGSVDLLQRKMPGWMEGGLGLRSLEDINKSLLMKLAWKMQNDNDEWAKFFQAKFQDKNGIWINYYKNSVWIGIKWVLDEVFNNSRCDGKSISVWNDIWITSKLLKTLYPDNSYIFQNPDLKVIHLLRNGEWIIPAEMSNMIQDNALPVVDGEKDRKIWIWNKTGEFTVTTAVECIRKKYPKLQWTKSIWKITINPSISSNVWKWLGGLFAFFNPIFLEEVLSMAKSKSPAVREIWRTATLITIKEICFHRNRVVYDGEQPNAEILKRNIVQFTKECEVKMKGNMWSTVADLQILKTFDMKCRKVKHIKIQTISFSIPISPKILLCCDGAARNNPSEAEYGLIGRDSSGGFLIAVAGGMGIATNYMAEIFAVINACEWEISVGFLQLCIRSDSSSAINSFSTRRIPWYVQHRWNKIVVTLISLEFIHNYREVNFSANGLAKMGVSLLRGEKRIFLNKPSFLSSIEHPDKVYYRFGQDLKELSDCNNYF